MTTINVTKDKIVMGKITFHILFQDSPLIALSSGQWPLSKFQFSKAHIAPYILLFIVHLNELPVKGLDLPSPKLSFGANWPCRIRGNWVKCEVGLRTIQLSEDCCLKNPCVVVAGMVSAFWFFVPHWRD